MGYLDEYKYETITDIEKYFEFYKKMYMRIEGYIPPVYYEDDKLIFESTDKEGSFLSITLLNTYESL
jgi:hypothetical protein